MRIHRRLPFQSAPESHSAGRVGSLNQQLASLVLYFNDPLRRFDRDSAWARARARAFAVHRGPGGPQ